ncbi:hypothetical protein ONA70_00515 [Micromonospora yasonensis]|uniref:hypothetical protein n=1 Tax=Micromonospora yasonensis TaxID=1128667 RepID=UPI00222EFB30|nr:hypothetical protein [Micromonospora yasonensis]MCW3838584.1 hypothetical protein [Micromonospora yasonensis]
MTRNKVAKQLASQQGISYAAALRQVRRAYQPAFPSVESLLPGAIASDCEAMAGHEIGRRLGANWRAGLSFGDVELPYDVLADIEVEKAEPDLGTVTWSQTEEFPDGDSVGHAEVEAEVTFTGYGKLAAVKGHPELVVVDPDVDGDAQVSFHRRVRLHWHVVYRPGVDYLDLTRAGASELVPINPHN